MTDGKQPGVRIDPELWEQFREEVERRRGSVRGHLRDAVENAFRDWIHGGDATPRELNERLQRIEAAVGAAEVDGGTDTFEAPEHTHTRTPTPTEKPPSNTATEKKVAWLAECVRDRVAEEFQEVPADVLREVVKDEYGFRSDTAKRYVEQLIDHFGLVEHPNNSALLCTPERQEEIIDRIAEQEANEVYDE